MTTTDVEPLARIWEATTTIHALLQVGPVFESPNGSPLAKLLPACTRIRILNDGVYSIDRAGLKTAPVALARILELDKDPGRGKACRRCVAALEAAVTSTVPDGLS